MTLLARRRGVHADKRERSQVVLEKNVVTPSGLSVAVPAQLAFLPLMHVVLTMARVALGFQFLPISVRRDPVISLHLQLELCHFP